jgi:hypothetical protein
MFIAELHDIGKLVDWDDPGLIGIKPSSPRHTFHNFDFSQLGVAPPSSPSWYGQWSDSLKNLQTAGGMFSGIPNEVKACVLLTNIADVLAASISRTWGKRGNVEEGVHLLWNPNLFQEAKQAGRTWAAVRDPDALKEMFRFIDTCPSSREFLDKYKEHLLLTPEDKSAPLNVIPLGTHLELTGKVFRVLRYHSKPVQRNGQSYLNYDGQDISQVREATGDRWHDAQRGKWIFRLVMCAIHSPQSIVRLHDLNVLELRRTKIQEIVRGESVGGDSERQAYAVLFHTRDFLCLFLPRETHLTLREVLRPLWESGFWMECKELEAELNMLTSTGARTREQLINKHPDDQSYGGRFLKLKAPAIWPDLGPVINSPICDLCQLRQGEEFIKDQVREWLCPTCRAIREMGEPAKVYARWEEDGVAAAWLKVSLDHKLLLSCLQRLFESYVDTGPGMNTLGLADRQALKEGFRPLSSQMEFVKEYEEFTAELKSSLESFTNPDGAVVLESGENLLFPIPGYPELAVVRLDTPDILGNVLKIFTQQLRRRFPACLDDCPIRLSVSMGNPKFPYQEHWPFFSRPQQPGMVLCIQQPGMRQIALTLTQYEALRERLSDERLSHFLHRLAAIEATTGETTVLFQALEQRKRFPQIHELMVFHRLALRQILDFYRLVGPGMREVEVLRA